MIETMTFVGDVWLGHNADISRPLWLDKGTVLNLEAPITRRNNPTPGKICLAIDPDQFDRVFPTAPLVVCLANNHIMDHGEKGFFDTIQHLERRGIRYYGAGTVDQSCNNPLLLEIAKLKVALIGYVCPTTHPIFATDNMPGVAPIEIPRIADDIQKARTLGAKRIVISLHWGDEEVSIPKPSDMQIAEELLRLGSDLIIGHHTHCRQPVYSNGNKKVFFSLGNAIFPDFNYRLNDSTVAWSRQRWWNNTGILVKYSPAQNQSIWHSFHQKKHGYLLGKLLRNSTPEWNALPLDRSAAYQKRYQKEKRFAYLRLALSRFLAKPQYPSPEKLKLIATQILKKR